MVLHVARTIHMTERSSIVAVSLQRGTSHYVPAVFGYVGCILACPIGAYEISHMLPRRFTSASASWLWMVTMCEDARVDARRMHSH